MLVWIFCVFCFAALGRSIGMSVLCKLIYGPHQSWAEFRMCAFRMERISFHMGGMVSSRWSITANGRPCVISPLTTSLPRLLATCSDCELHSDHIVNPFSNSKDRIFHFGLNVFLLTWKNWNNSFGGKRAIWQYVCKAFKRGETYLLLFGHVF